MKKVNLIKLSQSELLKLKGGKNGGACCCCSCMCDTADDIVGISTSDNTGRTGAGTGSTSSTR